MMAVGDTVREVQAENQRGEVVTVTFDAPTVLYFYPEDDTPGCSTEAEQFNLELETYREAGVSVYGVSLDDVSSHAEFAEKYDLAFDLLADPDGEIAETFGVDTSQGVADRTTFVIVDGEIRKVYSGVKPDGHARDVLLDMLDDELVDIDW